MPIQRLHIKIRHKTKIALIYIDVTSFSSGKMQFAMLLLRGVMDATAKKKKMREALKKCHRSGSPATNIQ
jgi:hypothetical protein